MTAKQENLKYAACDAIIAYLQLMGWKHNLDSKDESAFMNFIDPKTGVSHRADFAWVVQSERDIYEMERVDS